MSATDSRLLLAWIGLGGLLAAMAAGLAGAASYFAPERTLAELPSLPLAAGIFLSGVVYLLLVPLIATTLRAGAELHGRVLWIILAGGCAIRLILMASTPAFEDDWHRYLWDGAVTASGHNPYAHAPADAHQLELEGSALGELADAAGEIHDRINHPGLKTIYPPVAQAAFALAHWIQPFSLTAWRIVCLAGEAVVLALLLALLQATGRPLLWVALYWWSPVAAKELVNSAHMEAIVTPLVLLAIWLTVRGWRIGGVAALGLAIGAKLWPVLLAPLLLRPLLAAPRQLLTAIVLLAAMIAAWTMPPWLGGLDETSGFRAYAQHWQTNSALFPALARLMAWLLSPFALPETVPGLVVRAGLGTVAMASALWLARSEPDSADDLLTRCGLVTLVLLLASPAQFPWYLLWTLPFAVFVPRWGVLIASLTLPLYYVSFHYLATERYDVWRGVWVWIVWLPIWSALIAEFLFLRRGRSTASKSTGK